MILLTVVVAVGFMLLLGLLTAIYSKLTELSLDTGNMVATSRDVHRELQAITFALRHLDSLFPMQVTLEKVLHTSEEALRELKAMQSNLDSINRKTHRG